MASTSGRSNLLFFVDPPPSSRARSAPSARIGSRHKLPREKRHGLVVVAQAGQLPPASIRGGAGGPRRQQQETSIGVQPSSSSSTAPSTSSSSSSFFSFTATAVGALLALAAAAWAVSSFAKERGAVSSSASAAGLRGAAAAAANTKQRRSSRWKKGNDGDDDDLSGPPPRSYRAALSVTRRSVALTRAVQAAGFGNIAAALTELDKALAEHAAAGGSWEESSEEGDEGDGDEGGEGGRRRRWREALLPSGTGPEDVSFSLSFCFSVFLLVLLSLWDASKVAHPEKKTSKKLKKKQMRRLYVLHLQNSEDLFSSPEDLEPLRSLLRLSEEEAKEVEDEVLSASGGFSI